MWISQKTIERGDMHSGACAVGSVTIGGERPCVFIEGESRNAELVACGGLYIPKVGDEVLVARTADGENLVLGKISGDPGGPALEGEVYITTENGGTIRITKDGEIELSGTMRLTGTTFITGDLFINGQAYSPTT